jgi:hypothetical protein
MFRYECLILKRLALVKYIEWSMEHHIHWKAAARLLYVLMLVNHYVKVFL